MMRKEQTALYEENLEKYCKEWEYLDNEEESYTKEVRKMVKTGIPMEDWQEKNTILSTYNKKRTGMNLSFFY